MAARALIIAIGSYPNVSEGGMAPELDGTHQAGLDFRDWLVEKWDSEGRGKEDADRQILFCSEPKEQGGAGASRNDILKALLKLKEDGQGTTEELYFFFSGHGFSFVDRPGARADVLVSADFETSALSSHCCLNLDEIISWLRDHLGAGRHYYFVDACRNKLNASQIQVGRLLPVDSQVAAEATTFLLQSTVDGATAAVSGAFPAALLAGLRGKGNAKGWNPQVNDAMFVTYESLRGHLAKLFASKQAISSKVEGPEGPSDAVLATIKPIPRSTCTIRIANGSADEAGEVLVLRGRSAAGDRQPLGSHSLVMEVEPDNYCICVQLRDAAVEPSAPVPVDLYDDQTVLFKKVTGQARPLTRSPARRPSIEAMRAPLLSDLDIVLPAHTWLNLRNLETGSESRFDASGSGRLPQGQYVATLHDSQDKEFERREVGLKAGERRVLNLTNWAASVPHAAIGSRLPQYDGGVDFSESLRGAVTDLDLNLWLALLGGGRILGPGGDYSKIAPFPLHAFLNEAVGASPLYVLAGFQDPGTRLQVGVSTDAHPDWQDATEPPGMPGIREAYIGTGAGPILVSFRVANGASYTVASLASPNRATLITVTLDEQGNPCIAQYLLPLGHLVQALPGYVGQQLQGRNHLRDVRFLAQVGRAFRSRRNLFEASDPDTLRELLYAKWLDPVASSMAAYEFLRRGKRDEVRQVVSNMKQYFQDMPDTAAIARLFGEPLGRPLGCPLFLDGLKAFPDYPQWLPLPAGHLDFNSPWTAWRAAVS